MLQDHAYRTKIFNDLFSDFHQTSFAVRSADGWHWSSSQNEKPECTLVFKTAAAWRALMEDPTERTLGEAFINGDLDVEGDLFAVFPVMHYILDRPAGSRHTLLRAIWHGSADFARLLRHGPRHSMKRDQASISYHYDLPIDFYRPWLGPTLAYSCAYFRDPSESLESAQTNKLELICRKLGLRRGDRFLDIGCGWGSLVLHAASQYGAAAYGITLSKEQASVAASRISHAPLEDKCMVELRDYRKMPDMPTRPGLPSAFDKIASVGMFEHVGLKNLRAYFTAALGMLDTDGVFLNHGIARSATSPPTKDSFIDRYVFPTESWFRWARCSSWPKQLALRSATSRTFAATMTARCGCGSKICRRTPARYSTMFPNVPIGSGCSTWPVRRMHFAWGTSNSIRSCWAAAPANRSKI